MRTVPLVLFAILLNTLNVVSPAQDPARPKRDIYHNGWTDLNENGRLDVSENPKADVNKRIDDLLSQMTLDEKTCQTATIYGYARVLKDELPTPAWKNEVWKDGIANIDEHLALWDRSMRFVV